MSMYEIRVARAFKGAFLANDGSVFASPRGESLIEISDGDGRWATIYLDVSGSLKVDVCGMEVRSRCQPGEPAEPSLTTDPSDEE